MTFLWPFLLWSLVLIPVFIGIYLLIQQRQRRTASQSGGFGLPQGASGNRPGRQRHLPSILFILSLAVLFVALARPQTVVSLPRIEGTVILAFDVSGSMAATDFQPNRMDAAKVAARDFIERQPSTVQIGVVAFSDSGFSVQPPTYDQGAMLDAINRLTPQRGTSLANGIQASLNVIAFQNQPAPLLYSLLTPTPMPSPTSVPQGTYTPAVIVMLTDGENNESPDPLALAKAAADRGVRIYTVGIGSPLGTTLHINGFNVFTKLDEPMLQQISQISGGTYYNAQNEQELRKIYDELDPQLVIKPEKTEITSILAGVGILLLLVGGIFSFLWFNRLP